MTSAISTSRQSPTQAADVVQKAILPDPTFIHDSPLLHAIAYGDQDASDPVPVKQPHTLARKSRVAQAVAGFAINAAAQIIAY